MSMKHSFTAIGLSFALLSPAHGMTELTTQAQDESRVQRSHNIQREANFKQAEQQLRAHKKALLAQRDDLQAQADRLSERFGANENRLARLEEQLRLETGSLGEMFGVVRQNAKELQATLSGSVTGVDSQNFSSMIEQIVAAQALPSMKQLVGLWQAMQEEIIASGEIRSGPITVIDGEGRRHQADAVRIGALALMTNQGYMSWDNHRQDAVAYLQQPKPSVKAATLSALLDGKTEFMVLDPARGLLFEQLALTPTLKQRLEAGGVIGNIILVLLAVGLIIGFYRGVSLAVTRQRIKQQLKISQPLANNPLGRVLSVYQQEKQRSVEALELRLLEAVVDEQTGLEKGLSMLKLLAALAPMLGLLGTVTGMIETFQVITQFGNGDPKVMAGGISMALVTTVLGLVAAMPLLLAHNILSSQAETIRTILEKQGIGLVAEQAERDSQRTSAQHDANAAA